MKKFVFAFLMASACSGLVSAPTLRAQDSITIKDPAEFNAYQMATSQTDPRTKASQIEGFLQTYPQSVVKQAVLDLLVDTYQGMGDADKTLSAASRLLQMDPNNLKAILYSVYIKNGRCAKTVDQKTGLSTDPQTCDDAATLAAKGLTVTKPAGTSSDEWKKLTGAAMPIFHSAIALDDMVSKKDLKAAEAEYKAELMLYTDDQSKSAGLNDTLLLAQAYSQPGTAQDLIQAIWFYARVWDFAPPQYQAKIEPQLERFYKKYHGGLDGLDAIKAQAAATTFPPATFVIAPAPTPADYAHKAVVETPDLTKLNLEDTEFILANGAKDDVDKLWVVLKNKATPVPGIVMEASASVIKLAVTQDAKDAKVADFTVNMKTPLPEKEIPAAGFVYGDHAKGEAELDGIYDSYTQVSATATAAQTAEIVIRDGTVVPEKKKPVPHKPSPVHRAPAQ
ncbi:MAG: hypothetical protein ABSA48_14600 [Terracidiphilus sp.]|jgi:tetratricopeptide (TPR) repeat protein